MVAALVQSSTSGTTDTQSATKDCPVPAGAAAGHVAVLAIEIWLDTATDPVITWPSGFTQIAYVESATDGFQRLYVARKVLTGADTGNYTMSWSGSYWNQAQCTLWSGIDNTTPLDVAVNTAVTAANTTQAANSVTTVTAGCGMVHLVANENSATGTPPTGYTERQEANYLRTNTKVAGAAGTETPAGATISVSTVKLGALVALRPAGGGGGSTPAGTAAETDTAVGPGRVRTTTAGTVTETDAAQAVGRVRATAVTQADETDTAQPAGRIRATAAGIALETDTAQSAGRQRTTTAGTAAEADAAQSAGRIRTTPLGTATETDTAYAPAGGSNTPAGTALEVDTAQPIGRIRVTTASPATESDTGQVAGRQRTTTVGAGAELDQALTPGRVRATLAGTALELDEAQPVTAPASGATYSLAGRVESQWHSVVEPDRWETAVEPGRYITEVEA